MKEKLYTIPVIDAIKEETECPFCYIEKRIERDTIEFVLGSSSSYMERDVRAITDEKGFCNQHFKKMLDYGNVLGNSWILKTHYQQKLEELKAAFKKNEQGGVQRKSLFSKRETKENPISTFIKREKESCYICEKLKKDYDRYMESFIDLYKKDDNFKKKVLKSKGFCLTHFGDLCLSADRWLVGEDAKSFYKEMEVLMITNVERTLEDISWLIEKYDYRNRDAQWKNSKDAVPRGMQKLKGDF